MGLTFLDIFQVDGDLLRINKIGNFVNLVNRPIRGVNAMAAGAGPAHAMYFTCLEYGKTAAEKTTFIPPSVADGKSKSIKYSGMPNPFFG